MGNKLSRRSILPIVLVFIIFSFVAWLGRTFLAAHVVDYRVLLVGNALLFLVTIVSFLLYARALRNENMQVFLRMMYGGLLVKLFVCMIAAFVYGFMAGKGVNRNGIIGCFILYIVYTYLEVRVLMKNIKGHTRHV